MGDKASEEIDSQELAIQPQRKIAFLSNNVPYTPESNNNNLPGGLLLRPKPKVVEEAEEKVTSTV